MSVSPNSLASVLQVSDLEKSLAFYRDVLGFTVCFTFENVYAGLSYGKAQIHLSTGTGMYGQPVGGSGVYLFLDSAADVDTYHGEVVTRGASITRELINEPYGLRDFVVRDPDGNVLSFGGELEAAVK